MGPGLFDGTTGEDETQLCTDLDDLAKHQRFKAPGTPTSPRRDFAYLASRGIDIVRTGPVLHLRL